ncbi:MAG: DUF4214 domain-containing protein [Christensenellaceae bacterium]
MKRWIMVLLACLVMVMPITVAAAEAGQEELVPEIGTEEVIGDIQQQLEEEAQIILQQEEAAEADVPEETEEPDAAMAAQSVDSEPGRKTLEASADPYSSAIDPSILMDTYSTMADVYNPNYLMITDPSDGSTFNVGQKLFVNTLVRQQQNKLFGVYIYKNGSFYARLIDEYAIDPEDANINLFLGWDTEKYAVGEYQIISFSYVWDANKKVQIEYMDSITVMLQKTDTSAIEAFVTRLYEKVLGRPADPAGKAGWVNRLASKSETGSQVAYGFFFSPEFVNRNVSKADFVETLYTTMLDRPSDSAGKAGWVSRLDAGESRESVFAGFVNSPEFGKLCSAAGIVQGTFNANKMGENSVYSFVWRLYGIALGREADTAGLNAWVEQLVSKKSTGTQVAYGFFMSPEMDDKNLSDSEFVELLYRTILSREPSYAEVRDWIQNSFFKYGQTREDVFYGFANSKEFDELCASYGITR